MIVLMILEYKQKYNNWNIGIGYCNTNLLSFSDTAELDTLVGIVDEVEV